MPVPAGHVGYTRFYKPLRCCFELVVGCIDYPLMLSEVVFGAWQAVKHWSTVLAALCHTLYNVQYSWLS